MLSNRQERLLQILIREYIKSAKPVPSALLSKKAKIKVSSATIRNDMNDLEDQGFLAQLHTSGGRIPTEKAYRYFVNNLLRDPSHLEVNSQDKKAITAALIKAGRDHRAINRAIAQVLSERTGNLIIAGIAQEAEFFKQGLASLLHNPEFRETNMLLQLASFFEGFDFMFQLVEREFLRTLGAPAGLPIQILIGRQNPFHQGETIMCTKYLLPGDVIGSLTLVGPLRMDYEKNITLIKFLTDQLQKINQT
jgi:transcriptional regulator of heat shock response